MIVRKAELSDIKDVVAIHYDRFAGFFLSTLGKPFLMVFYKAFLKSNGILLVVEDEGFIKGFAAGSRSNRGFYKKLVKSNLFDFSVAGLKILLTKPAALKRIATNASKSAKNELIFAELLSIATVKNKKGYGKILLQEFENEVARKNIENLPVALTTDYDNNDKAVQFYKDCGYEVQEIFESYQKRKMYRFLKQSTNLKNKLNENSIRSTIY